MLEWLHPMRTSRYLLSETFSPWMRGVGLLASIIQQQRTPLPPEDSFVASERTAAKQVFNAIEDLRKKRDAAVERVFALVYGAAGTQG
jgi:hypothetical protein